jgi:hypothetical protein
MIRMSKCRKNKIFLQGTGGGPRPNCDDEVSKNFAALMSERSRQDSYFSSPSPASASPEKEEQIVLIEPKKSNKKDLMDFILEGDHIKCTSHTAHQTSAPSSLRIGQHVPSLTQTVERTQGYERATPLH